MSTPTPTLLPEVEVVIEAHLEEVEVLEGSASQTGEVIIIIMGEDETEALEAVAVVEVLAQECHHFLRLSAGAAPPTVGVLAKPTLIASMRLFAALTAVRTCVRGQVSDLTSHSLQRK